MTAARLTGQEFANCVTWPEKFPPEQWALYKNVMTRARSRGIGFAVGGGFARNVYTKQWQNTKDLDLFFLGKDREGMIEVLKECGLADYYERAPYDRNWIYRSFQEDNIIDIIWAMANQRAQVDEQWLTRGPEVQCDGERFRLVPAEETLWAKLFVLQHDRCDWTDAMNLLYSAGPQLDWLHLLGRLGDDTPLLAGLLAVFGWVCPERARELPEWVWTEIGVRYPDPQSCRTAAQNRAGLLDSRPWFRPMLDEQKQGD